MVPADGRLAISTFHPQHFTTFWLNPYFPSIRGLDEARFPAPATIRRELREAGFPRFEARLLSTEREIARAEALARIRGRHISTFDLLPAAELEEGTARAERELPARVVIRLERLIAVGRAG